MTLHAIAQPAPEAQSSRRLFLRRVWGLALRHYYLHAGSWPRIAEMLYWPIINMATWGFTSSYFVKNFSEMAVASVTLIASVLLVEIYVRSSTNMLVLFLEEVWSRNLGHLFASPIKFGEYVCGLVFVGLTRTIIALTPAILLAKWLFGFSLASLGLPLVAYVVLLAVNGCWYGIMVVSLLLRYGLAAEWMAWMATMLLTPLMAPYYPVSVLPKSLQYVSNALPATYVFECVKAQLNQQPVPMDRLIMALALNVVYFVAACLILWLAYNGAQKRGGLLQVGE